MVKDQLWESLTTSSLSQVTSETERFVNWQVSLNGEQWSTWSLFFRDNLTSLLVQDRVDTTNGVFWTLDFTQENWFLDSWLSQQHRSVSNSSHGWDDLSTTSVDSISVQSNIQDVNSDGSDVFTKDRTFLGSPLESSNNGILDFVQVLNSLGLVNHKVRTSTVRTETPNLSGVRNIPFVLVSQDSSSSLEVISWVDDTSFNVQRNFFRQWFSLNVDSVVLVWRLRQGNHGGFSLNSFSVRDNWRRDLQWNTGVVVLQVRQTNFQVQFTRSSDNVFTGFVHGGQDTRVRLGQSLQTFNQFWQVVSVLNFDSDLHNWRDREFHNLHVVRRFVGGDVIDWLDESTHHQHGSLDSLKEQVFLLTRLVVRTLNSDLLTRLNGTGKDTAESVESTLIGGWHHLGDVDHQVTLRVTVSDGLTRRVISWTFVQSFSSVSLGGNWRWQVENNHFQQSIGSWQEFSHNDLQQSLTFQFLFVTLQGNLQLVQQGWNFVLLEVHDGVEQSEDWVQDEHVESSFQSLSISVFVLVSPLLGLRVEVRVTPQSLHHLGSVDTEFLGVSKSKLSDGESPTVQTGTESHGTLVWVDLTVTQDWVNVSRDNDVNGFDSSGESLVQVFLGHLQFQQSTVNLVDNNNRLNSFTQSLTQHGLSLDTHTFDGVDHN